MAVIILLVYTESHSVDCKKAII